MSREEYTLFETEWGTCGIAWRRAGQSAAAVVTRFQLPQATPSDMATLRGGESPVKAKVVPSTIREIVERVRRHLGGEAQDFRDLSLEPAGAGAFYLKVYAAARKIPPGQTMSYGEVARRIKHPKAARAVGQALARNPIPLLIPCHRVLGAGMRAGGFSAPGGVETKEKLLVGEGALAPGVLKR